MSAQYLHCQLRNQAAGKCLRQQDDGTEVSLSTCNPANEALQWHLTASGHLRNEKSLRCLAVVSRWLVRTADCARGDLRQKWYVKHAKLRYIVTQEDTSICTRGL